MSEELSVAEWVELGELIDGSPPTRIQAALDVVTALAGCRPVQEGVAVAPSRLSAIDWLLYLGTLSSGVAFDRALLRELRRLSMH